MRYKTRFAAFFAAMVIFNLAANFAHPVTPTVIQNLGLHDYMFGVALAAMQFTNFLVSPFWGKLNSYIAARISLLVCCCGYGVAQVWFACSTTEPQIILARMFAGLFTGGVFVSFLTYVVGTSKPEDQGKHLTITAPFVKSSPGSIQKRAFRHGICIGDSGQRRRSSCHERRRIRRRDQRYRIRCDRA